MLGEKPLALKRADFRALLPVLLGGEGPEFVGSLRSLLATMPGDGGASRPTSV